MPRLALRLLCAQACKPAGHDWPLRTLGNERIHPTGCPLMQVATEGDAFTMAFHDPMDAISWAMDVQHKLLTLPWPKELLTQPDAGVILSPNPWQKELIIFSGLRVDDGHARRSPRGCSGWQSAIGLTSELRVKQVNCAHIY